MNRERTSKGEQRTVEYKLTHLLSVQEHLTSTSVNIYTRTLFLFLYYYLGIYSLIMYLFLFMYVCIYFVYLCVSFMYVLLFLYIYNVLIHSFVHLHPSIIPILHSLIHSYSGIPSIHSSFRHSFIPSFIGKRAKVVRPSLNCIWWFIQLVIDQDHLHPNIKTGQPQILQGNTSNELLMELTNLLCTNFGLLF